MWSLRNSSTTKHLQGLKKLNRWLDDIFGGLGSENMNNS